MSTSTKFFFRDDRGEACLSGDSLFLLGSFSGDNENVKLRSFAGDTPATSGWSPTHGSTWLAGGGEH
jgi:hypothetical protein